MKNRYKILIGVVLILICLSISSVTAADNNTTILEETNQDTISIPEEDTVSINEEDSIVADDDSGNYVAKNFGQASYMTVDDEAKCTFTESDLQTAKNNYMGVVKKYPDAKVIPVTHDIP